MRRIACLLGSLAVLVACTTASPARDDTLSGELLVFAAASLTEAFGEIAADFEERFPQVEVSLNAAGSQRLAGQIVQGAPADVFASANPVQMRVVADEGLTDGSPQTFAVNELAIAVEPGNPLGIDGFGDLRRPEITLVMAAQQVPAGRYARQALETAQVEVTPASLETDVRAVLSKVALGEADAGIVYRSDLYTAGGGTVGSRVEGVSITSQHNVSAQYPIAPLTTGDNLRAARVFVEHVLSDDGRAVLARYGFDAP